MPKSRAVVILIEGDRIALIERRRGGQLYYVFPGGGVEPGEQPFDAAAREALEELGLRVRVLRRVAESSYGGRLHIYYLVERTGGEFGSGTGKELARSPDSERGSVSPAWVALADLENLVVYPQFMAQYLLQAQEQGWPQQVVYFVEPGDTEE